MRNALALVLVLLAACASNHGVVDMGDGKYSASDDSLRGATTAEAGAQDTAREFCLNQGKRAVAQSLSHNDRMPSTGTIIFRCE